MKMDYLKLNVTRKTIISSLGAICLSFFSCIGVSGKSNSSEQPFTDEWGSLLKHELHLNGLLTPSWVFISIGAFILFPVGVVNGILDGCIFTTVRDGARNI